MNKYYYILFCPLFAFIISSCTHSTQSKHLEEKKSKQDVILSFQGIQIGTPIKDFNIHELVPDSAFYEEERAEYHLDLYKCENEIRHSYYWTTLITLDDERVGGSASIYTTSDTITKIVYRTTQLNKFSALCELYKNKYGECDSIKESSIKNTFETKTLRWDFLNNKSLFISFLHYVGKDWSIDRNEQDLILEAKRRACIEIEYRDMTPFYQEKLRLKQSQNEKVARTQKEKNDNSKIRKQQDI